MRFLISTITALASFSVLSIVFINAYTVDTEASFKKRHLSRSLHTPQLRNEHQNNSLAHSTKFEKRFENARFSLYDAGLGACGKFNTNSDFIVALNVPQYGGGEHCFETITINYRGKTTQAQVVDKCMECPYGAIDLARGLFDFFGSEAQGYLYGTWNFGSGASAPSPSTTKLEQTPKPQPSTTKQSTTTATPKVKSTPTSRPTATSESTTPSTTPSTTSSAIQSSTSPNIVPVAPTGLLFQLNTVLIELGGLAVAAAQID